MYAQANYNVNKNSPANLFAGHFKLFFIKNYLLLIAA